LALGHADKLFIRHIESNTQIDVIPAPGQATWIEWFDDSNRFIALYPTCIVGYNLFTHEELFKIMVKTNPWNKMIIIHSNFLLFEDGAGQIHVYDIRHEVLRAKSSKIA
jgi:hypothetical protein